ASSLKIRRFTTFSAIVLAVSPVSSFPTAISTTRPAPISPATRPSTNTRAPLALCKTALIQTIRLSFDRLLFRKPRFYAPRHANAIRLVWVSVFSVALKCATTELRDFLKGGDIEAGSHRKARSGQDDPRL